MAINPDNMKIGLSYGGRDEGGDFIVSNGKKTYMPDFKNMLRRGEAEETYDPFAFSDVGRRALEGEYIDSMRFFWFDPVTGEEGQTTEGYSRVPDSAKPYIYLNPNERNAARDQFYSSGAGFGGTNLAGGQGIGGGLLSGQAYAQQIAGGIPFEQVVAPGMSFSPDQPMGFLAEGATPFVPRSITPPETTQQETTFFPSVSDSNVGMTGADLGLPMGTGTPMPAGTLFDETSVTSMPATGEVPKSNKQIFLDRLKYGDERVDTSATLSGPAPGDNIRVNPNPPSIEIPDYGGTFDPPAPATGNLGSSVPSGTIGNTFTPAITPSINTIDPDLIPEILPNLGFPMPNLPILETQPVIPTMPVMTNFTVPQDPILNIENIISPIRTGGTRRLLGAL